MKTWKLSYIIFYLIGSLTLLSCVAEPRQKEPSSSDEQRESCKTARRVHNGRLYHNRTIRSIYVVFTSRPILVLTHTTTLPRGTMWLCAVMFWTKLLLYDEIRGSSSAEKLLSDSSKSKRGPATYSKRLSSLVVLSLTILGSSRHLVGEWVTTPCQRRAEAYP